MEKTLQMVFKTEQGTKKVISISDVKSDLNLEQVQPVMQLLVDKDVFATAAGKLTEPVEARYVNREVTALV